MESRKEYQKRYHEAHKEQRLAYHREWYQRNKDTSKFKESTKKRHAKWFQRNKSEAVEKNRQKKWERRNWLNDYKLQKGCSQCGFNKCVAALNFHHCNGEKEESLSRMIKRFGLERIKEEVKKCVVLCANCHATLHWEQSRPLEGEKPQGYRKEE